MAYEDRDLTEFAPPDPVSAGLVQQVIAAAVRLVGLAVLLLGLWAGAKVLFEAWALYANPARIERFAQAIEHGSNLDRLFSAAIDRALKADKATMQSHGSGDASVTPGSTTGPAVGTSATQVASASPPPPKPLLKRGPSLHLTYFAAWAIVLLLFLIIGSVSMSAITTGGHIALYDMQVRRFSRAVVRELQRMRDMA